MAKLFELDKAAWDQWVEDRPESVQKLCRQFPPDRLYRLNIDGTAGHRVTLHSYNENGTMTVNVLAEYNTVMFERQVFGIKPENLEECELPAPGEACGAVLTEPEEVAAYIDTVRAQESPQ